MPARPSSPRIARFGIFEADLRERSLHRNGLKVKLQNQPFEVLAALLERPGETLTFEELARRTWPAGTYVEFEHSLSTAVLKIRRVLNDSAESPRFIETVPRRGYRFVAPVRLVADSQAAGTGTPASRALRRILPLVAVAALVAAALSYLLLRKEPVAAPGAPAPLTTSPGWEITPSFSPDGQQVAFGWCEEGTWVLAGNCDILVKSVGAQTSRLLTRFPWIDAWPAWSPDGQTIAFLRVPPRGMAAYYSTTATSGAERLLAETFSPMPPPLFGTGISWFPDGRHLAVVVRDSADGPRKLAVLSLQTGARRSLTSPPDRSIGDTVVAVSPEGRRVAFVRAGPARSTLADIYLLELSADLSGRGEPRRLAADHAAPVSVTWLPEGNALLFSSGGSLWRMGVTAGGASRPKRLAFAGSRATDPALSRDGRRLAYSQGHIRENIWRVELAASGKVAGSPREVIASTRQDGWPQFSAGRQRVAFSSDRSGTRQLYVCDPDGSNLVQLTSLPGGVERPYPGWSPDGGALVFAARVAGNTDVFSIDARGGALRRLTTEASADYQPQWSRDGRWVYFASDRNGEQQIWRMPAAGGEAVQVTRQGGEGPFESPDGSHLFFLKAGNGGAEELWSLALSEGRERLMLSEVFGGNFGMAGRAIYFIPQRDFACDCYHLQRLDLATGQKSLVMDVRNAGGGLSVSDDGRLLLYTTVVHTGGDLMLVENFR